jgi:hypothetical protein
VYDPQPRSIWFYIGVVCVTIVFGPAILGFLVLLTWGAILIPIFALLYLAPFLVVNWLLWGR